MKNTYLTILLCFFVGGVFAQSTIKGVVKNQVGQVIKLIKYDDFITYKSTEIGRDTVDLSGNFSIETNIKETSFCVLQSNVQAGIYIEPKVDYVISFEGQELQESNRSIYVSLNFGDTSLNNINNLISQFNIEYDAFVTGNVSFFKTKNAKNAVDTFYYRTTKKYNEFQQKYFQDYINYSLATLRTASAYSSKTKLYKEYLSASSVLYGNDSYMAFFNQFYKQHFKTLPVIHQDEIIEAISVKMEWSVLDEIMSRDSYLSNDTIRELVMLKALKENYSSQLYSRKGILMILNQFIKTTTNEVHEAIALNIYQKLSSVDRGSYAPEFELKDLEGNIKTLSQLSKYKFVYLEFWATWCSPCIKEMKLMPELYKEYGDDIAFVSISTDQKLKTVQKFIHRNDYDWTILHLDGDEKLIELYKTKVIPSYFLIAPGGKVLDSPAKRPSEVGPDFDRIMRSLGKR
jgi:thiol-disulfide isomerase/thioredoxin